MRRAGVRTRRDRGAAAVEFALIAPILILLVFGIISYGIMLSFRQSISQAAGEGARAAAVAPLGSTDAVRRSRAVAAINQALGSYGVACEAAGATGTLKRDGAAAGDCLISDAAACSGSTATAKCVKVTLSYTYEDDPIIPSLPGVGLALPGRLKYTTEIEISQ
jgi:Flp pilus assembly protein TadG